MGEIIVDPRVFSDSYVPPTLWVRAKEAEFLIKKLLLKYRSGAPTSDVIAIYGHPSRNTGIGKTTLARYVAEKVREKMASHGVTIKIAYVNAYPAPGLHDILKIIARSISGGKLSIAGISSYDALKAIVDYLYLKEYYAIVILDEFQNLLRSPRVDDAYLYSLLRIYEQVPAPDGIPRISYILVASDYVELSRLRSMMPQVESQITLRMLLEPYTSEELYNILEQRAHLGLAKDTWDAEILWMIADFFGYEPKRVDGIHDGNARRAVNALRVAAEIAEIEDAPRIMEHHVRKAIASDVIPVVSRQDLAGMNPHELLVLDAIARLVEEKGGWSTTGEVRRKYEELAELYGLKPRGHSQFNQYINDLERIGLIKTKPSGKGMRGRTTLMTLPQDIPSRPLIEVVEKLLEEKLAGRSVPV